MKVSFEWLKDFTDIRVSPEETAHRLTMVGLEIEGMENTPDGDIVFEVNVTPNRPDCLSVLGIAREAAAALGSPLKMPDTAMAKGLPSSDMTIEILDPGLCGRYTGRLISGVKVCDTPEWIKKRLEKCGIRPLNNNIVDITNYVLLEFGHPLHAFDADRLEGKKIKVAIAGQGVTIRTLEAAERKLPEDALLIWDSRQPVAIAGVMGGEGSSVTADTKNVFVEAAWFEPFSIRRTSKKLGLKSESSYRFERGTDIEFLENALNRAVSLMKASGGGTVHEIVDSYPTNFAPAKVEVRYSRVNALLGTELKNEEMLEILWRIGLQAQDNGEFFTVTPPAYRRDIKEYVDVIEEIARIYNYSNIPVRNPRAVLSSGILNRKEALINKTKESVRRSGFSEVINYSFMNPSDLDMLRIPGNDARRRHLKVMNPLRQEDSLMRTTLVPSLINNFLYNISRGTREIRLFEMARVFIDADGRLPSEELRLSGIFYRERVPSVWKEDAPSFFIVKGVLQALFDELKVSGLSYARSEEAFLHKGKSADIMSGNEKLGFAGEISPSVTEGLDLKVHKPEIIVFELYMDRIFSLARERTVYAQVPRYPSIERDIAMIMDEGITSSEVMDCLLGFKSDVIESVELFDHYQGKNIPQDKKSLAFRVVYRSKDRTLTDSEVESIHSGLVAHVLNKTGGQLRG